MREIPFWMKSNLTIEEAAVYFSIGEKKLRAMDRYMYETFVKDSIGDLHIESVKKSDVKR